jgi:hypothetical protein
MERESEGVMGKRLDGTYPVLHLCSLALKQVREATHRDATILYRISALRMASILYIVLQMTSDACGIRPDACGFRMRFQ